MVKSKIGLRRQKLSDAKRFFEILDNDNFMYFGSRPKSIEDEKNFLKLNKEKRNNNFEHSYTILYGDLIVGAIGVKIDQHRKFIGEIGYFIDEEFWGKGIATKAVKIIEEIGFKELGIKRIEIIMHPKNIGSKKVAIKCGYKREGLMKSSCYSHRNKEYEDALLYAKVKL